MKECVNLRDFHSASSIHAGIRNSLFFETFQSSDSNSGSKKKLARAAKSLEGIDCDTANYRDFFQIESHDVTCIPPFRIFLTSLDIIAGEPDLTETLINFQKCLSLSSALSDLKMSQDILARRTSPNIPSLRESKESIYFESASLTFFQWLNDLVRSTRHLTSFPTDNMFGGNVSGRFTGIFMSLGEKMRDKANTIAHMKMSVDVQVSLSIFSGIFFPSYLI